tara:strand:+ start:1107 stop:1328 length:222 start_codon:yes stop_codon:yes gene_type:complete
MQKFRIDQILAAQLFRSLLIVRQPQTAQNADLIQTHTQKIEAIRERLSMNQQIEVARLITDILFNSEKLIELA